MLPVPAFTASLKVRTRFDPHRNAGRVVGRRCRVQEGRGGVAGRRAGGRKIQRRRGGDAREIFAAGVLDRAGIDQDVVAGARHQIDIRIDDHSARWVVENVTCEVSVMAMLWKSVPSAL